jgi:hypothetical protein
VHDYQFSSKQGSTSSAVPKDHGNGTSGDQTDSKPAEDTVPEDITKFYDKMDKEDEDDEEEAVLKTVSFEVNQVSCLTLFLPTPHFGKSQDSAVCIATGYGLDD